MKNKIKALFLSVIMLFMGACGSVPVPAVSETEGASAAKTAFLANEPSFRTSSEIAADMGIGWNLGNTMEAYQASGCEKISYK